MENCPKGQVVIGSAALHFMEAVCTAGRDAG